MMPEVAATPSAADRPAGGGPVFVGGAPRSGKTLVRRALADRTGVVFSRRTNLWTWHRGYGDLADRANLDRCLADLLARKQVAELEPDVERLRRDLQAGPTTYPRLFQLLHEQVAERAGRPRWGDQSAHLEWVTDELLAAHPDARIIQLIRDPRDVFVEARQKYGSGARLGVVTARWLRSAHCANRHVAANPESYRVVRYEDLVAAPERSLAALADFIGEALGPSTAAAGSREAEAITDHRVGRYRSEIDPSERVVIERLAGPAMDRLGYRPDGPPPGFASAGPRRLPDLAWFAFQRVRDRRAFGPRPALGETAR